MSGIPPQYLLRTNAVELFDANRESKTPMRIGSQAKEKLPCWPSLPGPFLTAASKLQRVSGGLGLQGGCA